MLFWLCLWLSAITVAAIILGALFRRWWGEGHDGLLGWPGKTWKGIVKRVIGFALPSIVTLLTTFDFTAAAVVATMMGFSWWAIPGAAWGTGMGRPGPNNDPRPLDLCILSLSARYGLFTVPCGLCWYWLGHHDLAGLIYAPVGLFAPACYGLGWWAWDTFKLLEFSPTAGRPFKANAFCFGELLLGALLIGGIPAATLIARQL